MTQLEATDNQATASPIDGAALAGTKWQADYHSTLPAAGDAKVIKVADDGPAQAAADGPPGQGAADAAPEKVGVKEIVGADPKDLSPNEKVLQGLASHFDKTDDKAKAMGEVKAEVLKTIAAADANLTATETQVKADGTALQPKFEAAQAGMKAAGTTLQAAMDKVPKDDKEHVGNELNLLADDKTSPALRKAIEADLAGHPGLVPAANGFIAAEKAALPVMQQVQALKEKLESAAEDPVITRMVYADMLEQSGDKAGAKQVQAESMALQMGMTIEQFQQLQQQQKQQQPKP